MTRIGLGLTVLLFLNTSHATQAKSEKHMSAVCRDKISASRTQVHAAVERLFGLESADDQNTTLVTGPLNLKAGDPTPIDKIRKRAVVTFAVLGKGPLRICAMAKVQERKPSGEFKDIPKNGDPREPLTDPKVSDDVLKELIAELPKIK